MSTTTDNGFEDRIDRVKRSHLRLARGYDARMGRDGLIVFLPRRQKPRVPLRSVFLSLAAFLGFKVFVLMQIGEIAYQSRIDALLGGSWSGRLGSHALGVDPVTRAIADQAQALF